MKYTTFHSDQFRRDVDNALLSVQRILETHRTPRLDNTDHTYDDKYALVELMTNTAISAQMNVMERMGLTGDTLKALQQLVQKRTVTLRLEMSDTCQFLKEQSVNVATPQRELTTTVETTSQGSSFFGGATTTKEEVKVRVNTTVKEYHWRVGVTYRIFAYAGNEPDTKPLELQSRSSSTVIVLTGQKTPPFPDVTRHSPIDTSLTWILQRLSMEKLTTTFKIDRSRDTCKTPLHNDDTRAALAFFDGFAKWSRRCVRLFHERIDIQIMGKHAPVGGNQSKTQDLQSISSVAIFCPILPLMEDPRDVAGTAQHQPNSKSMVALNLSTTANSPLMSPVDMDKFMNEHVRTLEEQLGLLQLTFSPHQLVKLVTVAEASLMLMWSHTNDLFRHLQNGTFYIEDMITKQVIAAIGKEVHSQDFDQFMAFHNQKLFAPEYAAKPFCYAIRRPDHYPDGILSIECTSGTDNSIEPINTIVRHIPGDSVPPMFIPIHAATCIQMTGPRFLHGWMQHRFASSPHRLFTLTARARQFSSFMLLVGVMAGPDRFNPKDAIILQNKDEVLIPLLLKELPTAKEFKDAIASLSPEQQQFATAFRGMQLESSVFGVCVIQLKPQMEVLLGLPKGALTKEIRLTQDLMSLFVDYQIPSDLVSFDGDESASTKDKVAVVKDHVKTVLDVIADVKKNQLIEAAEQAAMNVRRRVASTEDFDLGSSSYGSPAPPMMAMAMEDGVRMASPMIMATSANPGVKRKSAPGQRLRTSSKQNMAPEALPTPPPPVASAPAVVAQPPTPSAAPTGVVDFTTIPKELDAKFERYDTDSSIRATVIETAPNWTRRRQENLLTKLEEATLLHTATKSEQNKAFDLLDALSRSGTLPIACAELHVVVAITHCFENDVMGTVIQDNVNPIEKVEKSSLLLASTIYGCGIPALMKERSKCDRLAISFPDLFALTE